MRTTFERWQITQLERLFAIDRDRVEGALGAFWEDNPDLLEQAALSALDTGELTLERTAQILRVSMDTASVKLAEFQRQELRRQCVVVGKNSATLAEGGLPVWEVVRVYRKLGTFEKLLDAFSGVSQQAVEAALAYADRNPAEIDQQIARYEALLSRRRSDFPYMR